MAVDINDTPNRVRYTATAGQTAFSVPFQFLAAADLKLYQNGVLKTLSTHYTVTGAGASSGTVTLVSGAALSDDILIIRDLPVERIGDFPISGPFDVESLNRQLDAQTMMVRDMETRIDRRLLRQPVADLPETLSDIPAKAARANLYLGFDANGQPKADLPNASEIADYGERIGDLETISGGLSAVGTVADNIAGVTAVAAIDDKVVIAANNVADINNFADVYQGGKAADPTLRNDGTALQTGDLYFNTTNDRMRVYETGTGWIDYEATAQAAATTAQAAVTTATTQAGIATTQATSATTSAVAAGTAKTAAEAARDAALLSQGVYPDVAAGLAAVTVGNYFSVPVSNDPTALILYRVGAGPVANEITRYLSAYTTTSEVPFGYAWSVMDSGFRAAIGVLNDGTFVTDEVDASVVNTSELNADTLEFANTSITSISDPTYGWSVVDQDNKVALGVAPDGTVVAGTINSSALIVDTINGASYFPSVSKRDFGFFSHQINFINTTGQSLSEGSTPAVELTTTQEYDNIGFPARSASPSAFVSLTTGNTAVSGRGESPMYGASGHIKELIAEENGITYLNNDYQLVGCNNGYSGYSILQLNKGTTPYSNALAQISAANGLAIGAGKTMSFQALTWTQGESDPTMPKDTYKGHLKQLIADYTSDAKAITGQFNDPILISYQLTTINRDIALAQLEASNESDQIFVATPMYHFDYGDSLHINATSAKWLGGYYGLVYKRVIIDRQDWKPLQPIAHAVLGSTIDIIFNRDGLVLDTTLMPAQTNYGFDVINGSGASQSISSVAVMGANRVRITLASATPAPGWAVRYGFNSASGKTNYSGGCGNLRDSQGNKIIYSAISKPMHNWCVLFSYGI